MLCRLSYLHQFNQHWPILWPCASGLVELWLTEHCGWVSSSIPLWCPNCWRVWLNNGLRILCIQSPLGDTSLSIQPTDSCWSVLHTWRARFQRFHPMGLSAPAAMMVAAIWLENFSCCLKSTNSCPSLAEIRIPTDVLLVGIGCSPALTKVMASFTQLLHWRLQQ